MLPRQIPPPQAFGKFQVLEFLGEGGMGRTFKAKGGDRIVALKVPLRWLMDAPDGVNTFLNEGRAAQRLPIHPNLCVLYGSDIIDEIPYLEMQFLPGGPIGWDPKREEWEVVTLVHTLAKALHEAHQRNVIHGDLKPSNILLNEHNDPVITDFGLALRNYARDASMPAEGSSWGTPGYMAPEQAGSWTASQGAACDIFGLGVILYELLCGQLPIPFQGPLTTQTLNEYFRVLTSPTPLPAPSIHRSELSPEIDRICLRALAKSPEQRYPNMDLFARDLINSLHDGKAVSLPPPAPPKQRLIPPAAVQYLFVATGTTAPRSLLPDRVYLDIGNDLRPGVLDHHQLEATAGSSCRLVINFPHLIQQAVNPNRADDAPFTFLLHESPDLTCAASAFLARALLVEGGFPEGKEVLADYIDDIARGGRAFTSDNPFTLYAAYRLLRGRLSRPAFNSDRAQWQTWVENGIKLIEFVLHEARRTGKRLAEVDAFDCPEVMQDQDRQTMQTDRQRYLDKLHDSRTQARTTELTLPRRYRGEEKVAVLLIDDRPDTPESPCFFFRDWARTDSDRAAKTRGFVVLAIYHPERPGRKRKFQVMVRPDSGLCLRGLSERFDEAEAQARTRMYGMDDRVVDPILLQRKSPRPGFTNSDPWYDGRSNFYTIVESPKHGTYLTDREMEDILLEYGRGEKPVPLPAALAPAAAGPVVVARPRIAILQGLFDPPGSYERNLVVRLLDRFDRVVVSPSVPRPGGSSASPLPALHRAALADLAFSGLPRVIVDLADLVYDRCPALAELEERSRLVCESPKDSEVWHVVQSDRFSEGGEPLALDGSRFLAVHPPEWTPRLEDCPPSTELMPLAGRIPSAELRSRVAGGAASDHVSPQVAAYIRRHGLYTGRIPTRQSSLRLEQPRLKILFDRHNDEARQAYERFRDMESADPEMILVLGGDGTMLRAIWDCWRERLPFFGVNHGHLGFLMNNPEENPFAVPLNLYRLPMLRVEVETADGKQIVGRAFMDAWIERQGGQTGWMQVKINREVRLEQVVADGMLVATPAGSSAYARAMGAPSVPLGASVLTLVGSNVFIPDSWKPVVLPDDAVITLTSTGDPEKRPMRGFLDGRPLEGLVKTMTIRLGNVSDVELAFLPRHDPEVKMLQTLFPRTKAWKS